MVRAHIEGCPGCQQDLKAFQALSASLDAVPVPPVPASAVDVIMARVQQQRTGLGSSWDIIKFWKPWPVAMRFAAAGTVAVACLVGLTLGSATFAGANRTRSEMAWVGLASGDPLTSAYLDAER